MAGIAVKGNPHAKIISMDFFSDELDETSLQGYDLPRNINKFSNKHLLKSVVEESILLSMEDGLLNIFAKFNYAAEIVNSHKVDIVNLSVGVEPGNKILDNILANYDLQITPEFRKEMIEYFDTGLRETLQFIMESTPNTLYVMASGNSGENSESTPYLKMTSNHPRGLVVAAADEKNNLAKFSNFGTEAVNIAAMGTGVFAPVPDHGFLYQSGTSMATPQVVNVAAKVKDAMPDLSPEDIKKIIVRSAIRLKGLEKVRTGLIDENGASELVEEIRKGYIKLSEL